MLGKKTAGMPESRTAGMFEQQNGTLNFKRLGCNPRHAWALQNQRQDAN